ncbi:MAG: MFS transporter [Lachnospiraceae bacterium]|nr:MFS transporter [Lachnospiraceae bacterium]
MTTVKEKLNKKVILQAIGILCISFLLMGASAVTASLQLIGKMFPDIPYSSITLIETSPALASIPFCILSGLMAGKKVSFRKLAIIGMAGFSIFGAVPFFLTNFTALLICRLLLGACMGILFPLSNALMILSLPQKIVSTMVGLNLVIQNIGILVLQNVAGALVKISTPYIWLCYLICFIPFIIMILFLKNPATAAVAPSEGSTVKTKMPGIVWPLGILLLLFCMFFMVSSSGLSQIVIDDGIGTVDDVTLIFNVNIIVSLILGLVFGVIYMFTKKLTVYIGFALSIIGMGILGFGFSIPVLIICSILLAIGYVLCYSSFVMEINASVPQEAIAKGTAVLASLANLGVAFSSTWYKLVQDFFQIPSMRIVMYISAGGLILTGIIHLILQKTLNRAIEKNSARN